MRHPAASTSSLQQPTREAHTTSPSNNRRAPTQRPRAVPLANASSREALESVASASAGGGRPVAAKQRPATTSASGKCDAPARQRRLAVNAHSGPPPPARREPRAWSTITPTSTPHSGGGGRHESLQWVPALPPVPAPVGMRANAAAPLRRWRAANAGSQRHPPAAVSAARSHHKPTLAPPRHPHGGRPPSPLPRGAKPARCRHRRWPPLARGAPATTSARRHRPPPPVARATPPPVRRPPPPHGGRHRQPKKQGAARPLRPPPTSMAGDGCQFPPRCQSNRQHGVASARLRRQIEAAAPTTNAGRRRDRTAPVPPPPATAAATGERRRYDCTQRRPPPPMRDEPWTRAVAGRRPARATAISDSRCNHSPPVPCHRRPRSTPTAGAGGKPPQQPIGGGG